MSPPAAAYSVSASQVKTYDQCERAWYLGSVARASDDGNAGGQYLLQGDLFDEAVQRFSAKMDLGVDDLVGAVRAKPGLRGAATTMPEAKWAELAERAQRMLRATQHLLPAPKTARVQHRYRVPVPGYEAVGGVVVTGALDLRRPGEVWDTKTTSDRGPGRGAGPDRPAYALTDATTPGGNLRPLADDVQASLYAWCEFADDPLRLSVRCTWVYVTKPAQGAPHAWSVTHVFLRADTLAWFDSYVRPRVDRMVELHRASEFELAPLLARANVDACGRCFKRLACDAPFHGAQAPIPPGALTKMATIAEVRAQQAARRAAAAGTPPAPAAAPPALEDQLRASVAALPAAVTGVGLAPQGLDGSNVVAVGINRPNAPTNPAWAQTVVTTTGVEVSSSEAPAVALREALAEDAAGASAPAPEPAPLRGRGRPRKPRPASEEAAAGTYDPAAAAANKAQTSQIERLERIATALQAVADAADSAVQVVNAELRALGVRL